MNSEKNIGVVVSLGTTTPNPSDTATDDQCRTIEITLTHPPNSGWLNALSKKHKEFYFDAFGLICRYVRELGDIKEKDIFIEYHKNGLPHCHGFISFIPKVKYFIEGMLTDIAKLYLKLLPKKYQGFKQSFLKQNPHRIYCPPINANYFEGPVRTEWRNYIKKCYI